MLCSYAIWVIDDDDDDDDGDYDNDNNIEDR